MKRSDRWLRLLLPIALLTGLLAGLAGPAAISGRAAPRPQQPANGSVVISEFRSRGPVDNPDVDPTGDSNEFIEIYNRTGSTLEIGGWKLKTANDTGSITDLVTFDPGDTIGPGQHILIVNSDAPDALWNMSDWDYTGGITDNGGVALFDTSSQKIDAVGMSQQASDYWEQNPVAPMTGNADESYQRKGAGCTDTGDNSADFLPLGPIDPQDSTSITPCPNIVSTTTTITSDAPDPSIAGAAYIVQFSVTANQSSSLTPTGTVMVSDSTQTCFGTLTNGTGQCSLTSTTPGTKNLTATYSGDGNFLEGFSAAVQHTVTQATLTQVVGSFAIIINEVAWAGTQASPSDEWIELYNPGTAAINLTGWRLESSDGNVDITWPAANSIPNDPDTLVIPGGSYYLIERDDDNTVYRNKNTNAEIKADKLYTSAATDSLADAGTILYLYDPHGNFIDSANIDGGGWPAGSAGSNHPTMERYRSNLPDRSNSWVTFASTNPSTRFAWDAGIPSGCAPANCTTPHRDIYGTPKQQNWAAVVTITPSPQPPTRVPTRTKPPEPRPVLNEFLPRAGFDWNQDGRVDVYDEFIEVANIGPVAWNTNGWKIDTGEDTEQFVIPAMTIGPGERALFYGHQSGLRLTDGGATVRLLNAGGVIYDAQTYTVAKVPDQSWCRIKDLKGSWFGDCFPTPNFPNSREGELPSLPPGTGLETPLCRLADTLPEEIILAECRAYGDAMWSSRYWDLAGWRGDRPVIQNGSKWESYIE